jgi:hypothetical protein
VDETTGKKIKDYMMKRRLYGRFRKSKDTDNYSSKDMSEIFGKKKDKVRLPTPHPCHFREEFTLALAFALAWHLLLLRGATCSCSSPSVLARCTTAFPYLDSTAG